MQPLVAVAIASTLVLSMAGGLLSSLIILTIGFSKVQQVERYLDMPETAASRLIGDSWLGRVYRTSMLVLLFSSRRIPGFGPHIVRQMGKELEPVPLRLKLWVTLPTWALIVFSSIICLVPWLVDEMI